MIANIVDSIAGCPALRRFGCLAERLVMAEAEKVRIEGQLGQTPTAERRVIELIPGLVKRIREIVGEFRNRAYVAGGPAVTRARAISSTDWAPSP